MARRKNDPYHVLMAPDPCWGDIYIADLGPEKKTRPVIVIQNNSGNHYSEHTIVVPITSRQKADLPTHVYLPPRCGIQKPSTAVCETILTIDKAFLLRWVGSIRGTPQEKQLLEALKTSLNIKSPSK